MTNGKDNVAEHVSDVLDLIRLRRQSGLLNLECWHNGYIEEGEIYFQEGRPIYARYRQLAGQEALDQMIRWQQRIYFSFSPNAQRPHANIMPPVDTRDRLPVTASEAASPATVAPGNMRENTGGLSIRRSASVSGPLPLPIPISEPPTTPGIEWLIPEKRGDERQVLALPLTRPQRSLYMLIDGHRTVSDLARCMRKNFQEIERLLHELQERGVISL